MTIDQLNNLKFTLVRDYLLATNASEEWVTRMIKSMPFPNLTEILILAKKHWESLSEKDYLQAFEAHPKIGDLNSLKKKYENTKAVASKEQSGVGGVSEEILQELADLNEKYFQKFGFIFIIFATGKSAVEMLNILRSRIGNSRIDEIKNASVEQLKITRLRLEKLCQG